MFQLLSRVCIGFFIAVSIYSIGAEASPTSIPECRPGEFYDQHVFKWRKCSICFTPEGEMFAWNCNHCKCKKVETTTPAPITTQAPITTSTPINTPTPETTPTPGPILTPVITAPTTTLATNNNGIANKKEIVTTGRTTKDEPGNVKPVDWKYPALIISIGIVVVAIISLFIHLWQKNSGSQQQQQQGCFKPAKHGTACTDYDENRSSPGTSQNSSTNTLSHGYFQPPCDLDPSGKHSFTLGYSSSTETWV